MVKYVINYRVTNKGWLQTYYFFIKPFDKLLIGYQVVITVSSFVDNPEVVNQVSKMFCILYFLDYSNDLKCSMTFLYRFTCTLYCDLYNGFYCDLRVLHDLFILTSMTKVLHDLYILTSMTNCTSWPLHTDLNDQLYFMTFTYWP